MDSDYMLLLTWSSLVNRWSSPHLDFRHLEAAKVEKKSWHKIHHQDLIQVSQQEHASFQSFSHY